MTEISDKVCNALVLMRVYVAVQNTNRCGAISSRQGRTARRSLQQRVWVAVVGGVTEGGPPDWEASKFGVAGKDTLSPVGP